MSKVVVVSKKQIQLLGLVVLLALMTLVYLRWDMSKAASGPPMPEQIFHLVTGEFVSETADGKKLEVYSWHPGTIIVQKGAPVELRITGVNGSSHPFVIEGMNVRGTVEKGKTTSVRFTPTEAGTYPIVCLTHRELKDGGPMVGYLVVQ